MSRSDRMVRAHGFRLTFTLGDKRKSIELCGQRMIVGRQPSNDIPIDHDHVSRSHAILLRERDTWSVVDNGSVNGTWVNGERISEKLLAPGDILAFGSCKTTFEAAHDDGIDSQVLFVERTPDSEDAKLTRIIEVADVHRLKTRSHRQLESTQVFSGWALGLFDEAAEALHRNDDLDGALESMMALVFRNLADVERGFIGLYDEQTDKITPRIVRLRDEESAAGAIEISRSITNEAIQQKRAILVQDARLDARFANQKSVLSKNIRSAMCAPMVTEDRVCGILYVDSPGMLTFDEEHLQVFTTLACLAAIGVKQMRLRDRAELERQRRNRLARYSSRAVVDRILELGADDLIVEQRVISVVFADLCGFTSMAEDRPPEDISRLLNTIFGRLTNVIFSQSGTLDKFMGDGFMAFFGAPLAQPDHAVLAVRAALEMQRQLRLLNDEGVLPWPIQMRVGINSGAVVAGDIGCPTRKDYTVIGDVVNIAARLESSVARPGEVVIGPETHRLVGDRFSTIDLGPRELKGKRKTIHCYRVSAGT